MDNSLEIQNLQSKIAYLERHIEEQDKEILRIDRELALVAKEMTKLRDKVDSQSESNSSAGHEERPPHY